MEELQIFVLAAFHAARVEFAVVGGVAVIAHGYVRATHDIDLFIRPSEENARRAFDALKKVGLALDGLEPADLLSDDSTVRLGPAEDHIDILPSIGEMSFDQVWRNRVEVLVGDLRIPFISKADLIQNKRQVGRLRDLNDVDELERLPGSDAEFG